MEGLRKHAAECVHFGGIVCTGIGGMGGPFLVPVVKLSCAHSHVMHLLGGF